MGENILDFALANDFGLVNTHYKKREEHIIHLSVETTRTNRLFYYQEKKDLIVEKIVKSYQESI